MRIAVAATFLFLVVVAAVSCSADPHTARCRISSAGGNVAEYQTPQEAVARCRAPEPPTRRLELLAIGDLDTRGYLEFPRDEKFEQVFFGTYLPGAAYRIATKGFLAPLGTEFGLAEGVTVECPSCDAAGPLPVLHYEHLERMDEM